MIHLKRNHEILVVEGAKDSVAMIQNRSVFAIHLQDIYRPKLATKRCLHMVIELSLTPRGDYQNKCP